MVLEGPAGGRDVLQLLCPEMCIEISHMGSKRLHQAMHPYLHEPHRLTSSDRAVGTLSASSRQDPKGWTSTQLGMT